MLELVDEVSLIDLIFFNILPCILSVVVIVLVIRLILKIIRRVLP